MNDPADARGARRSRQPSPATGFEAWRSTPAQGDELLDAVATIAALFERPFSDLRVKKGLALDDDGLVPLDQLDHALDAVGLRCHLVRRPLAGWNAQDVPAILLLADDRPVVLTAIDDDGCWVRLSGASSDLQIDRRLLESAYSGQGVIVRHDPASETARERPWDQATKQHWFWSEVWKERSQYGYVMFASLLINLLAFAMPLFTMNVYDRIIPNKAAASLWMLALGALFAIAVEYGLRLARTGLIAEVGRGIDARLAQPPPRKGLNLPKAAPRRTGLARGITTPPANPPVRPVMPCSPYVSH